MKNLIFINGTMGVGKTTTSKILQKQLPKAVFLDGDWCWDMSPFTVTEETKNMVIDNITYVLNNFISCSEFENIIFCWVMHEQSIIDDVLSKLDTIDCKIYKFSIICSEEALIARIKSDIKQGIRSEDVIERSLPRLQCYYDMNTEKVDVSNISPKEAASLIYKNVVSEL
jgi:adenylate kinase family enzyme